MQPVEGSDGGHDAFQQIPWYGTSEAGALDLYSSVGYRQFEARHPVEDNKNEADELPSSQQSGKASSSEKTASTSATDNQLPRNSSTKYLQHSTVASTGNGGEKPPVSHSKLSLRRGSNAWEKEDNEEKVGISAQLKKSVSSISAKVRDSLSTLRFDGSAEALRSVVEEELVLSRFHGKDVDKMSASIEPERYGRVRNDILSDGVISITAWRRQCTVLLQVRTCVQGHASLMLS